MGLEAGYIDWMDNHTDTQFGHKNRTGLLMFELGNQELCHPIRSDLVGRTGKSHYTSEGYTHISVDMNGQDGALPLDLRDRKQFEQWFGGVDVLTNSGTTEHVEPHSYQYDTFSIIHSLVKTGGLIFHIVPDVYYLDNHSCWKGHCTNYYSKEFFDMLGRENNYLTLDVTYVNDLPWTLIAVAYKKLTDQPFMANKELFLSHVSVR